MNCGALGIIPARADATRFPNKMTARILNKPMLQYVWEKASCVQGLAKLLVATDSQFICDMVVSFGGRALVTPSFASGTDRVSYVAASLPFNIIVNIQGDEPLLNPEDVDNLIAELSSDPEFSIATSAVRKNGEEELQDPNVVKVIVSKDGEALYFSRHPLRNNPNGDFLKHIGIYAYRKEALLAFCQYPPSALELSERLEQLRALENGLRIKVIPAKKETIAVDTPLDLIKVEKKLLENFSDAEIQAEGR